MTSDAGNADEREREELDLETRRLEAMGRLAAGIAHDFNNVLAAIHGYGQIVLRSLDTIAAGERGDDAGSVVVAREALERVRADVARLDQTASRGAALTHLLATLSRPGGGTVSPLDLNAFAAELRELVRRLIPARVEVALSSTASPVIVRVDEARLWQAMLELLLELRDALPNGGRVELEIAIAGDPDGGRATLVLRHGATATAVPGQRTRGALSDLARSAGGSVRVESGPAGTSAVTLELPLATPPPPFPAAAAPPAARTSGGATVLLVEDDPAVLRIARTVLERLGHRVVPAGDGREALRLVDLLAADDVVPDLLVTDVSLPGMSGPELAEEVGRRAPGIVVLFMSGMGDPAVDRAASRGGGVAFLEKPFALDDLAAHVASLLDQRS